MGVTKTESYTTQTLAIAQLFKALGHPARVAILQFLAQQKSCICGDIVSELPLSQASISRHLSELKEAGLIKGTISGTSVCYCINTDKLPLMTQFLNQLNSPIDQSCCS
ncbi:MAG: ArsR/SmtB family transcription factor [Flavobacteriales bacterium]